MNNMENFLSEKYRDLPGSRPVERAVEKKLQEGKTGPTTKGSRVETYLDRLEGVVSDERGFGLLKRKVLNRFTINAGDEETLSRLAQGLFESEKRMAIEQGRGGDVQKFESTHDIVEHYKPLVLEKEEIQRKTLSAWLDYLQENDAKQPNWFRYLVVRSLEKMGTLDKEKLTYGKRGATTVAPFPELNSEALGWAFKRLDQGIGLTDLGAITGMSEEELETVKAKQETVEKLIEKKDFSGLYAFAQVETAGHLNQESLQGEWRKYDKGSDFQILEGDLHGKGTGWCTAEGSAESQLEGGDFYVYYTKTASGYTAPRVAIRMEGDSVGEVRGVNHRQEIEPELIDIAQAKYHELPGGESYDKQAHDMKEVTRLVKKQEGKEPFTKEELTFLYELDSKIEGFGHAVDPRIAECRNARGVNADLPIFFNCAPEDIAHAVSEISEKTKIYVGPLEPGIFNSDIEHIFTSFPDGKLQKYSIKIGGTSKEQLRAALEEKHISISPYANALLNSKDFATSTTPESANLVKLSLINLGLGCATTDEIYARATELGLDLCPAEVGPQLRLSYTEDELHLSTYGDDLMYIAMKQIADRDGAPVVFCLNKSGGALTLGVDTARPDRRWFASRFAFRLRK